MRIGNLILLFFLGFLIPKQVVAATKSSGSLHLVVEEPMFPSSIIWYPGLSRSGEFTVENKDKKKKIFYIEAIEETQEGNLAKVFEFKISQEGVDLYGGTKGAKTLSDFWAEGALRLSEVKPKETKTYQLTLTMSPTAGNEYQAKKASFDLRLGFWKEEVVRVVGTRAETARVLGEKTPGELSKALATKAGEVAGVVNSFPQKVFLEVGIAVLFGGVTFLCLRFFLQGG